MDRWRSCVKIKATRDCRRSLRLPDDHRAQEIFKDALQTPEIRLRLVKGHPSHPVPKRPPPVLPKPRVAQGGEAVNGRADSERVPQNGDTSDDGSCKVTTSISNKKPLVLVSSRNANAVLAANTRKIGKKIKIQLLKGNDGLGFSITTRDNPAGGNCPIYIKNILPKGAAIQEGSLKPGDRLLEVNNIEMTGKSQTEAVAILRNTPLGGEVKLVVSRQEAESPKLPREMVDSFCPDDAVFPHSILPQEKASDDSLLYPWKHRKVMTFDIPLNDTGSAGLGVSVKGKTSTGNGGTADLGIFVKSVITGGAASKDGRLKENDQLVCVNGASLLGMCNSQAMETLRKAIQQDGPTPGAITLTVARRVPRGTTDHSPNRNDTGSVAGNSSDTTSASEHSDGATTMLTVDIKRRVIEDCDLGLDTPLRNPVIERLTGQRSGVEEGANIRNESYYRATQNGWGSSMPTSEIDSPDMGKRFQRIGSLASPTVNMTSDDTVMIEDEYLGNLQQQGESVRSSMPDNMLGSRTTHNPVSSEITKSSERRLSGVDEGTSCTSQISLDSDSQGFSRDGFGRQSMSEKRHAHLDARNTDTYQRSKKAREEKDRLRKQQANATDGSAMMRASSADSLLSHSRSNRSSLDLVGVKDVGPSLGLKKSSSLESLQTLVTEAAKEGNDEGEGDGDGEEETFSRPAVKAVRARGCNESFRAAVDRSYEGIADTMDTLDEESESGSWGRGRGGGDLRQSSLTGEFHPDEMHRRHKNKGKKKGLLKGLGSVFKFGKNRKLAIEGVPQLTMQDLERQRLEAEKIHARKAAQDEQGRIQEQYRKLLQHQSEQRQQGDPASTRSSASTEVEEEGKEVRQDRMSQLRAQHQRKHQERRGQYPGEGMGDGESDWQRLGPARYSFQVYPSLVPHRRAHSHVQPQQKYESEVVHVRSHSYDLYNKDIDRPGSRLGFADSSKYSHYANYEEIQQHLIQQQQKKKQLHAGPKAGCKPNGKDRPASNYYEYESLQPVPRLVGTLETSSLPRRTHRTSHHANAAFSGRGSRDQMPQPPSASNKDVYSTVGKQGFRTSGQYVNASSKYAVINHPREKYSGSKV